ncbi:hypothetical protein SUDANB121_04821 [Nocardiopsis dassonvillei]|uniref:SelT/SelW/SelH family protein n=1 Tax=Nocardiopsis dassonvillei TaxID=2014 RepID=UPI003F556066
MPENGLRLEIGYRTRCRRPPRATWMAQEPITAFEAEPGEVALIPGSGGVFEVRVGGEAVWSRGTDAADTERPVRDRTAPDRPLGRSERSG